MVIQNREALEVSLDRIREWDFDRVIVGHGEVLETGGKAAFAAAFPPLAMG